MGTEQAQARGVAEEVEPPRRGLERLIVLGQRAHVAGCTGAGLFPCWSGLAQSGLALWGLVQSGLAQSGLAQSVHEGLLARAGRATKPIRSSG